MKMSKLKIGLMIGSGALALLGSFLDSKKDEMEVRETAKETTIQYLDEMFKRQDGEKQNPRIEGEDEEDGESN